MDEHNMALTAAGIVGSVTAVIHGVVMQRRMVAPLTARAGADRPAGATINRLTWALLHYSTLSWFLGGLVLIAAAVCPFSPDARLATGLMVGGHYLYGALGNAWATRGRHPGWMLLALAVGLIGYGLYGPGV